LNTAESVGVDAKQFFVQHKEALDIFISGREMKQFDPEAVLHNKSMIDWILSQTKKGNMRVNQPSWTVLRDKFCN